MIISGWESVSIALWLHFVPGEGKCGVKLPPSARIPHKGGGKSYLYTFIEPVLPPGLDCVVTSVQIAVYVQPLATSMPPPPLNGGERWEQNEEQKHDICMRLPATGPCSGV